MKRPAFPLWVAFSVAACAGEEAGGEGEAEAEAEAESESEAEAEAESESEAEAEAAGDCGDGVDNDGDGLVDEDDPGCDGAGDPDETNALSGDCGDGVEYYDLALDAAATGTHAPGTGAFSGSCGGFGIETIYHVTITEAGTYVISTVDDGTTLDTVIYVRTDCAAEDTEVGCNDQGSDPPASTLTVYLEEGDAYLFVDGWSTGSAGSYVLHIGTLLDQGEPCDEGIADQCAPGLLCRDEIGYDGTVCFPPICSDGDDDDGDGIADFPYEPGCDSPEDGGEDDDCPTDCPECADGDDNDGDGNFDWPDDPGCFAASDAEELDECIPGVYATEMTEATASGTTDGTSNFAGGCGTADESSGEDVYSVQVPPGALRLRAWTTGATYYTTLYVRTVCDDAGSEVACASSTTVFSGYDSTVEIDDPPGGTYYIFVDGYGSAFGGSTTSYTLNVLVELGDGVACDPASETAVCGTNFICRTDTCEPTVCSDGVDNDGDGLADYPEEPGCEGASDDDEDDPCPGAGCPECADGDDNDTDGTTDWPDDTSCTSASDDNEACESFGTDTYGYQGCEEVLTDPSTVCPDISSTGSVLSLSDDSTTSVSLGFSFDFYGTSYSSLTVGSNGKIGPTVTSSLGGCVPGTEYGVMAWYDDLYPPTGAVYGQSGGSGTSQWYEVQWVVQHYSSSPGTIDVRAVIRENGDVDVCYVDSTFGTGDDYGASAGAGIQGTSSDYISYSCNEAVLDAGLVLHYVHP